ncbi:MAG: EamA family transporter [Prevotellaceae bacterium]|nr:EamA family transporter [Candidatus Colivivens equi]
MNNYLKYGSLIGINLLYACVTIFTKYASQQEIMSINYLLGLGGAVVVMGIYAILWQQVLKRIELSTAYMFKGTSLVFVLLLAALLFDESITWTNIVGAMIIISGIALYARA